MNTDRAREVLPYVGVLERTTGGLPCVFHVPCSPRFEGANRGGPQAAIVSLRVKDGEALLSCQVVQIESDAEPVVCKAEAGGHVCYHCLASLQARNDERGQYTYFYVDTVKAQAYAASKGGQVVGFRQGTAAGYMVLIPKPNTRRVEPAAVDRVAELEREVERLKAKAGEVEKTSPVCGKCGKVLTGEQVETGLCSGCDRSYGKPEVLAPVAAKATKRRG